MRFFKDIEFPYYGEVEDGHCRCHTPIYYGIQFNASGTLRLRIGNGKLRTCQGPCAFITHPGAKFCYEIPADERHGYYVICFTGAGVNKFVASGLLDLSPEVYKISDPERFRNTMKNLTQKHREHEHDFCVLELQSLLLQLHNSSRSSSGNGGVFPEQYEKMLELAEAIRKAPAEKWDFHLEARKHNMSLRYFRMVFTKVNQLAPHDFMLKERLARSARALISGNDTISAIAGDNGFDDVFYFSRIFKKHYHLPPSQYRKEFS